MRQPGLSSADCIFLRPGEFWFGTAPARLQTILGSCITITLWHPGRKIGGMCHYMLPETRLRLSPQQLSSQQLSSLPSGRTAGEAMALFLQAIHQHHTGPGDYEVKLFGGASFFPSVQSASLKHPVSVQNVAAARQLLREHEFRILRESVGGRVSRKLVFDLGTGDTWLSMGAPQP